MPLFRKDTMQAHKHFLSDRPCLGWSCGFHHESRELFAKFVDKQCIPRTESPGSPDFSSDDLIHVLKDNLWQDCNLNAPRTRKQIKDSTSCEHHRRRRSQERCSAPTPGRGDLSRHDPLSSSKTRLTHPPSFSLHSKMRYHSQGLKQRVGSSRLFKQTTYPAPSVPKI